MVRDSMHALIEQLPAFNRLAELARSVASVKVTDGPVSCGCVSSCVVVAYVKWYAINSMCVL
jgi:hypothetical protein